MKKVFLGLFLISTAGAFAQQNLTPELLWKIQRVSGKGITPDGKNVVFSISSPSVDDNKSSTKTYMLSVDGGTPVEITNADSIIGSSRISPDGKYIISSQDVKLKNVYGTDLYPDLGKSDVYIYDSLNYRHWDEWEDGKFGHVFVATFTNGKAGNAKDIMPTEPYDCPQKPSGGDEDFIWSPDSKSIVYVCKKKYGTDYAVSTNTDLYSYDITTAVTTNLTEKNKGYDVAPEFSKDGQLAWLQMRRDGYEADKQDIVFWDDKGKRTINLTGSRDNLHVEGFKWSTGDNRIFFYAPIDGTLQLFQIYMHRAEKFPVDIQQVTKGDFDITGIVGQHDNTLIVTRMDMNHATEIYTVNLADGSMKQLTHVNDAFYNNINMVKTERRFVTTTDNKQMLVWVIYPPGFDATKKYPTLLYCQGGPQSPLTQFYSFRWNFQLMASQGYIVVAPNRRGMPGHGTQWNEEISKDHGGQAIRDYLSAIDDISKEKYVDTARRGCIGASYGGYSVYFLAGVHNNRFKTFIAHDGIFDFRSMYGSTEELFFINWDYGGSYWDKKNAAAQKSYNEFSPSNFVSKWNRPILIYHGGKDYRIPAEQAMQAFQAAQLMGLKSRFVYLPEENHWVLQAQNAMVWQREFYRWLDETLK